MLVWKKIPTSLLSDVFCIVLIYFLVIFSQISESRLTLDPSVREAALLLGSWQLSCPHEQRGFSKQLWGFSWLWWWGSPGGDREVVLGAARLCLPRRGARPGVGRQRRGAKGC